MNLLNLFWMSVLTENIILTKFLGICPFMGTSNKEKKALSMGISVMIIVVLSSIVTYLIYYNILVPTNTEHLKTLLFIFVIAAMVGALEMIIRSFFKSLYKSLGIYLPLITTNCSVLGIALLNINNEYSFKEMITFAFGSSLGFLLIIYLFSTLREKIDRGPVPKSFKGFPIALVTASIMALLFTRYVGV